VRPERLGQRSPAAALPVADEQVPLGFRVKQRAQLLLVTAAFVAELRGCRREIRQELPFRDLRRVKPETRVPLISSTRRSRAPSYAKKPETSPEDRIAPAGCASSSAHRGRRCGPRRCGRRPAGPQERDRQDGDELADRAGGLDGDRLQRPCRLGEVRRQRARVGFHVRGEVIAVVVVAERRVAAQVLPVLRRLVRELVHLLDHAGHHDGAHERDTAGERQIQHEDRWRARQARAPVDGVDDRQQRQRHEEGDDHEPQHVAHAPREIQRQRGAEDDRDDAHDAAQGRRRQPHRSFGVDAHAPTLGRRGGGGKKAQR
jgi:hypothetical protein